MKKLSLILLTLLTLPLSATTAYFCDTCYPCNDLCGVFGGFEALYFTAEQEGLEYARDDHTHTLEYDWNFGGRGWYGYQGGGWDGVFVYDWITNRGDDSIDNLHSALFTHPASGNFEADQAKGDIQFKYQSLDLLFGRSLGFCNQSLLFRPYLGVRGVRFDNKLRLKYSGGDFDLPEHTEWELDLKMGGLHAGMESHFFAGRCFGVYGGLATSLLYGRVKSFYKQPGIRLNERPRVCIPGLHLKSGLVYRFTCPYYFDGYLKLGYEFSTYYNMPKIRRYTDGEHEGVSTSASGAQLTLHGATLSAELIF